MDDSRRRHNAEEWHRRVAEGEFDSDARRAAKVLHWDDPAMAIRLADEAADTAAQLAAAQLHAG